VVADHAGKIYAVGIGSLIVILAFLALTSAGHVVDAAVQHFMLFYAGVFALIALCASVGLGLVATDRMVLGPGHRVFIQSAHRIVSFGALVFLVIHIVTEILAQRIHVIDAFIPFLVPFKTFYIGLGTISSDLILLIVITSIFRKRFTSRANAWKWRAIHYTAYVSFVFGVWHGLLGGRPGKPYVDWSYGFVVAFVALGLGVRILSNSLRPKETLSSAPVPESGIGSGSAPMRAAAMFAQLKVVRDRLSAGELAGGAFGARFTGPVLVSAGQFEALPAAGRSTGAMPVTAALTAPLMEQAVTTLAPGARTGEQPVYEPGYVGPARYQGAPRSPSTGPMPRLATGSLPGGNTGSLPWSQQGTGPLPKAPTGPLPRAATGPLPRAATGPLPRAATGPMPRVNPMSSGGPQRPPTGPMPRPATGPMPRPATGPMPRAATGPMPRPGTGPMPRPDAGPMPRPGTGPMPRPATGPMSRPGTDPRPRPASGPMPRAATGPMPRPDAGPMPRPATGPMPRPATGPMPRAATGPMPRAATGPMPRPVTGPMPRPVTGPMPRAGTGPMPRPATGPLPRAAGPTGVPGSPAGPSPRPATGPRPRPATGPRPRPPAGPVPRTAAGSFNGPADPPWEAGMPELDPRLRNRDPGPGMPGYRPSAPRGGDPYATDPYAHHLHSADEYSTPQYSTPQYSADPYQGADGYGRDEYGRDGYEPDFYSQDGYGWDGTR
jgi:DMSO/TMAO reductase YedYZ heme-binding membrane subunit